MNEQVSRALTDLLEKASNGIDSTVAFSQANLPEVIHQLLTWKMTMGVIWSVVGVALIALAIFMPIWAKKAKSNGAIWTYHAGEINYNINSVMYDLFRAILPVPILFLGVVIFIDGFSMWLKILLAPKLYLIEYTASLIK
ncbi:TPA: hypothetical protein SLO04_001886 [Proteus mirabilis]|uniref:hypothetical protein n=1 Tax=Proteus TaxID=583 RepID=UPI001A30703C|nr:MULTISPECIES: hypothetical protein [Proteus]MDF7308228.1 hypothetical protein [Proteus mirabilis]HAT5579607.1 hypothetical protein [Proteus mirabilis]HAT5587312.1 hypothetical protein [Proteus mirabilis]HDU8630141.1 hypothetical protein [Proteus mirabilis]HEI9941340.1 hypothetical protein [Proteus mirabilis]